MCCGEFESVKGKYTQVKLVKGNAYDISWIPSKFAKVGMVLKIKTEGVWDDGWTVEETYSEMEAKNVLSHERDYLKNRKASDI